MLVNRMKSVLPSIIDDTQSAFVPGRSIFDNIIVAHESISAMKKRVNVKAGFAAASLTLARPMIRWIGFTWRECYGWCDFQKSGFKYWWIVFDQLHILFWLMAALVAILFLWEGWGKGIPFHHTCSLALPKVFPACWTEPKRESSCKALQWLKMLQLWLIYFLQMIVCYYSKLMRRIVIELLIFWISMGLLRDNLWTFQKSAILFSTNTKSDDCDIVMTNLGITRLMNKEVYLGVPLLIAGNRSAAFRPLKEKVCSRINNWSNRFLSQKGRSILIKSIAQTIMHCFKLPRSLCMILIWPGFSPILVERLKFLQRHSLEEVELPLYLSVWWGYRLQRHGKFQLGFTFKAMVETYPKLASTLISGVKS